MLLVACANPVLDHIFQDYSHSVEGRQFFDAFCARAGGFGPNAARALQRFGSPVQCFVIAGGGTGRALCQSLRSEGISVSMVASCRETRIATILCHGSGTEMFVSPSPPIELSTLVELFKRVQRASAPDDRILVGGSVRREIEAEYFAAVSRLCRSRKFVCCDIRTEVWQNVLAARPFLMKVPSGHRQIQSEQELWEALDQAAAAGVQIALGSIQQNVLYVRAGANRYRVDVPVVPEVNRFGAGDCLIATLAAALAEDADNICDALVRAVAAAAASVSQPIPGDFATELAQSLRRKVTVSLN